MGFELGTDQRDQGITQRRHLTMDAGRICAPTPRLSTACPQHIHRTAIANSSADASHLLRTHPQALNRRPDRTRCGRLRSGSSGCAAGTP